MDFESLVDSSLAQHTQFDSFLVLEQRGFVLLLMVVRLL
jgi:hypothetical protein